MEPATALGLAAGIGSVVVVVSKSIATLNAARIKFSEGDLRAELLIGQLHTVRTALSQVQEFINTSSLPDSSSLVIDLNTAVEHCRLLVVHIDDQLCTLNRLPNDLLTSSSKAKMVLEERVLRDNMMLLNNQISALNLCLTAYQCRTQSLPAPSTGCDIVSLPEPDVVPQLDDTPSMRLAKSYMNYSTQIDVPMLSRSQSHPPPNASKRFDLDRLFHRSRMNATEGRPVSRAESEHSEDSRAASSTNLKNTMLKLSNAMAQSTRVEQTLRRDSMQKQLRLLVVGQRTSTVIKRIRFALSEPPTAEELERARKRIVPYVVSELLALSNSLKDTTLTSENMQRLTATHILERFDTGASADVQVSSAVKNSARTIWASEHVQAGMRNIDRLTTSAYFLKALPRVLDPHYQPTLTDLIKIHEDEFYITEATVITGGIHVNMIDAPQPKIRRLVRHFEDADAFLLCLDLSTYTHYSEHSQDNEIERALKTFRQSCKSSKVHNKPIILLMYNAAIFRRKLAVAPFHEHFADCKDAKTYDDIIQWLLKYVRKKLQHTQPIIHHCAEDDAEDDSTIAFFESSISELPQMITCVKTIDELVGSGPSGIWTIRRRR